MAFSRMAKVGPLIFFFLILLSFISGEEVPKQAPIIPKASTQALEDAQKETDHKLEMLEQRIEDALDLQSAVYTRSVNELNSWLTTISIVFTLITFMAAAFGLSTFSALRKAKRGADRVSKQMTDKLKELSTIEDTLSEIRKKVQDLLDEKLANVESTLAEVHLSDITKLDGGDLMQSIRFLRANKPNLTPSEQFLVSASLYREHKYAEAEAVLEGLLKLEPHNLRYINSLGLVHLQQKRPGEAYRYFDQALKIDSSNSQILLNLAVSLSNMGNNKDALETLTFVTRNPDSVDDPRLLVTAAAINISLEKPDEALELLGTANSHYLEKGMRVPPDLPYNQACAFALKGDRTMTEKHLNDCFELDPNFVQKASTDTQILNVLSKDEILSIWNTTQRRDGAT